MRHANNFHPVFLGELAHRFVITDEHGLERFRGLPFGMLWRELAQAVKGKHGLPVQGMLGPKRAVLVKSSDTVLRLNKFRTRFCCGVFHEGKNGLLCGSVIPRRQRISLGLGIRNPKQHNAEKQYGSEKITKMSCCTFHVGWPLVAFCNGEDKCNWCRNNRNCQLRQSSPFAESRRGSCGDARRRQRYPIAVVDNCSVKLQRALHWKRPPCGPSISAN